MKPTTLIRSTQTFILTLFAMLLGFWSYAQDNSGGASVNVSTTKTTSTSTQGWYTSPWVWVIGAAVFILLLVALLSNRGGSTTVTRRTTTTVE